MKNLSQIKREKMISFLEKLRKKHDDEETLIVINEIEIALTEKNMD